MKTAHFTILLASGLMFLAEPTSAQRRHLRGLEAAETMFMSMPASTEPTTTAATTSSATAKDQSEVGNTCDTGSYSWSRPCASSENYCSVDVGACKFDNAGTCQVKPQVCAFVHLPVCGCDGTTYANECAAHVEGVNVAHEGACEEGNKCGPSNPCIDVDNYFCRMPAGACKGLEAEQRGTCASYGGMAMCPMNWAPVCGCDGKVYSNSCAANSAGVSVARDLEGLDVHPFGDCEIDAV